MEVVRSDNTHTRTHTHALLNIVFKITSASTSSPSLPAVLQMALYCSAVVLSGLTTLWCGPQATELMFQMKEVEQEHGLGNEIGPSSEEEAYDKLWERDLKYRNFGRTFLIYNTITSVCNLTGIICTITNLVYKALKLSSI